VVADLIILEYGQIMFLCFSRLVHYQIVMLKSVMLMCAVQFEINIWRRMKL